MQRRRREREGFKLIIIGAILEDCMIGNPLSICMAHGFPSYVNITYDIKSAKCGMKIRYSDTSIVTTVALYELCSNVERLPERVKSRVATAVPSKLTFG